MGMYCTVLNLAVPLHDLDVERRIAKLPGQFRLLTLQIIDPGQLLADLPLEVRHDRHVCTFSRLSIQPDGPHLARRSSRSSRAYRTLWSLFTFERRPQLLVSQDPLRHRIGEFRNGWGGQWCPGRWCGRDVRRLGRLVRQSVSILVLRSGVRP
jgi:hypothetical protein